MRPQLEIKFTKEKPMVEMKLSFKVEKKHSKSYTASIMRDDTGEVVDAHATTMAAASASVMRRLADMIEEESAARGEEAPPAVPLTPSQEGYPYEGYVTAGRSAGTLCTVQRFACLNHAGERMVVVMLHGAKAPKVEKERFIDKLSAAQKETA